MRTCPFRDCTARIDNATFACLQHWRRLTPREQARLKCAYDDYRDSNIGIEKLREVQQTVLGTRGKA
jgi:hypothetical protein